MTAYALSEPNAGKSAADAPLGLVGISGGGSGPFLLSPSVPAPGSRTHSLNTRQVDAL